MYKEILSQNSNFVFQNTTDWLLVRGYNHTTVTSEMRIDTTENRLLIIPSVTAVVITVQNRHVDSFTINYYGNLYV